MSPYLKLAKYKSYIIICLLVIGACIATWFISTENDNEPNPVIQANPTILLYVKEGCYYCKLAKQLLEEKSLHYEVIELSNNEELYDKLVNNTGQTTVPYIFINGQLIGGYSDLQKLNEENKL